MESDEEDRRQASITVAALRLRRKPYRPAVAEFVILLCRTKYCRLAAAARWRALAAIPHGQTSGNRLA
jgi:hypothetical protein